MLTSQRDEILRLFKDTDLGKVPVPILKDSSPSPQALVEVKGAGLETAIEAARQSTFHVLNHALGEAFHPVDLIIPGKPVYFLAKGAVRGTFLAFGRAVSNAGREAFELFTEKGVAGAARSLLDDAARASLNQVRRVVTVDFSSSAGRVLGETWRNIGQLKAYLRRQGVGVISGADGDALLNVLSRGTTTVKNAAFIERGSGAFVVLRSGATKREVMHEIGHMLAWKKLGSVEYWALPEAMREHMASTFVRESSLWRRLLPEEVWAELMNIIP